MRNEKDCVRNIFIKFSVTKHNFRLYVASFHVRLVVNVSARSLKLATQGLLKKR